MVGRPLDHLKDTIELCSNLGRLVIPMARSQRKHYKAYSSDTDFREWLNAEMFRLTYQDRP